MKKLLYILTGALALCAMSSPAGTTVIPQGKIAVMRTGDGTLAHGVGNGVGQDFTYVDIYDTATLNQGTNTLYTVALATNVLWINGHAGTEGAAISRSADHATLALAGYTGPMNYAAGTPSSAFVTNGSTITAAFTRGFGILDPILGGFTLSHSGYDWFGLPNGVTQNNPTGIATKEGLIFYGTGNVTPIGNAASGVQFFYASNYSDGNESGETVYPVSPYPSGAGESRIIGGQLYIIATSKKGGGTTTNGIYTFVDQANGNAPVPFPWDPTVANPVEHIVTTNLFLNFDAVSTQTKLAPLSFDMNTNGTVLYAADQTYGIYKFVNNGSGWAQAYFYSPTNLGTTASPAADQGIFSICVDFTGTNPVIYATTMENGTVSGYGNSQGNPNENRLLRIVDTGSSPGTNLVAQTLATALNTNVSFRGIDFSPDLRPYFLAAPANVTTTNNGTAAFNAPANAPSALSVSYQWYQTPSNLLSGQTASTLTLASLNTNQSGTAYFCVASDTYGSVTSSVATLNVNFVAQAPVITNSVANVSGYVNNNITFASVTPTGTTPFNYQWYFGGTALTDGAKYTNSQTSALTIFGLTTADSGNYYLVASNVKAPAASNLVDVLTVSYVSPVIGSQPVSVSSFVGTSVSLNAVVTAGTTPITYQWYQNGTALTENGGAAGEFTGTQTATLSISPAQIADTGTYYVTVANANGQTTNSSNAVVTITPAPALSYVSYTNQVYTQNFDSLPYQTNASINAFNNPESVGSINGIAYSVANPFDFAYPILTSGYLGGLGLSNTMPGWYGAAYYPAPTYYAQIGAGDGDQTTGGDLFFGNLGPSGTNRALGLQTTSSVGPTAFALKLINNTTNTLNYINLAFVAEQWRLSTGARTMSVGYTVDPTANSFTLAGGDSISNSTLIPALAFSFPTATNASADTALDGTLAANQTNLSVVNYAVSGWTPGSALWLIWGMNYYGVGKGNGYAIDNLSFSASANAAPLHFQLGNPVYSKTAGLSLSFTNLPGASFTVYSTTNLSTPNWISLGHPVETANGSLSTYNFTDAQATNKASRFYKVTSP